MGNICIHTTLMNHPKPKKHGIITITRGATSCFNFPLFDKVYGIDNIIQMIFAFRQGKTITWFNMVDYFIESEDTTVDTTKTYYTVTPINLDESMQCKAEVVASPTGSPKTNGYYELVTDISDTAVNTYWRFDDHFSFETTTDGTYSWINFNLKSSETKNFKLTEPDSNMEFEVTIKLDTDSLAGMNSYDSIIIEPQHPVAVVDSIYNYIDEQSSGGTAARAIPSVNTLCSVNLLCNKYV